MSTRKKKDKDRHKWPVWGFRFPPAYREQMEKAAIKSRRKASEEVKIAMEEYLEKLGLWPPKEQE
jgi:hypothetical protein